MCKAEDDVDEYLEGWPCRAGFAPDHRNNRMAIIQPTVGRKVWFWERPGVPMEPREQPQDATICYVHSERLVNLRVSDRNGNSMGRTSVALVQEGDALPRGPHCTWMLYQLGQARATQAQTLTGAAAEAARKGFHEGNRP